MPTQQGKRAGAPREQATNANAVSQLVRTLDSERTRISEAEIVEAKSFYRPITCSRPRVGEG